MMNLSIIVPVYNEKDNIEALYAKFMDTLPSIQKSFEIIFVDDKSTDGSKKILAKLADKNYKVKVIFLKRNSGQTAAITAGIQNSVGDIIITLDADLQNDPSDITKMLDKIDKGYDLVSGWRRNRKDKLFTRKIPSWIANRMIAKITGVKIHDFGCTLKAYKQELFEHINLYGEMHRFIPAYAAWAGARIAEVEVTHHPRLHGKTNYGLSRTFKVLLDLITVKFLGDYSTKPIYIFGGIGFICLAGGVIASLSMIALKLTIGISMIRTPLLSLSVLLVFLGVQFILMGLLAELSIRVYHESQNKPTYIIEKTINYPSSNNSDINEKLVKVT